MIYYNQLPMFPPEVIGLDIETSSLDPFTCIVHGIGISDGTDTWILDEKYERLLSLLQNNNVIKIVHNAVYDIVILWRLFGFFPENVWDTLLIERVLTNGFNVSNDLATILARRNGILLNKETRKTFENHIGPLTEEQQQYLSEDVLYLPSLRQEQIEDAKKQGLEKIIWLESACLYPVLDMTVTGVGFDQEAWDNLKGEIEIRLQDIVQKIIESVGEDFIVEVKRKNSVDYIPIQEINFLAWQQTKPLMAQLGIKLPNTQKATLEANKDKHPFIPLLLEYKLWAKRAGWSWEDHVSSFDNRIHPGWNQAGTDTGRFSGSEPNLQNVPRDSQFRALFQPLPGHTLICADFSQQEPRVLAHLSQDPRMVDAAKSADIYIAFARDVYNKEVTKEDHERHLAKTGVLATFYGVYPKKLAEQMGISYQSAEDTRNTILKSYPVAARWGDHQIKLVTRNGYSETAWGRKRYYPEIRTVKRSDLWKYTNISRNTPVQGTAADIMKLSLVKIYAIIKDEKWDAHLIWTVHDEVGISVCKNQAEELYPLIIQAMVEAGEEICPDVVFLVDGKITDSWSH